jgi:hypothetical protein
MRATSFKHEFWGTAVDDFLSFDLKGEFLYSSGNARVDAITIWVSFFYFCGMELHSDTKDTSGRDFRPVSR